MTEVKKNLVKDFVNIIESSGATYGDVKEAIEHVWGIIGHAREILIWNTPIIDLSGKCSFGVRDVKNDNSDEASQSHLAAQKQVD